MESIASLYDLIYTVGELLTCTWPGRIVLGLAVASVLARIARA